MSARSEAKERRPKAGHEAEQAGRRSRILEHVFGLHTRSRRVISEHRHRRKLRDREVSDRSRRGLDWTNFFLADVQLSFGSFLAFYLADLGWSKQNVGLALTVGGLAAVAAQIPGGALADAVRWKRALAASGFAFIAAAALILALRPGFSWVFVAEILHGTSAGLIGPAIAAISLGIAGRHGMSSRIGRNYRFAGGGNARDGGLHGCARGLFFEPCHIHCRRYPVHSRPGHARRDSSKRDRLRACAQCRQARPHARPAKTGRFHQELASPFLRWRSRPLSSLQCFVAASGWRESGA